MTFAYPILGYILIFICLFIILLAYKQHKRGTYLKAQWGKLFVKKISTGNRIQYVCRMFCIIVAVVCFCIAFARPQWGFSLEKREQVGLSIIFALDTSKSMLANDVRPNRLELAKMSILERLKSISGNQVGLIAFAGDAFLQCPSTADYGAFKTTLKALNTKIIPKGGTNIASAMQIAAQTFETNAKYKQMLLLTDGENLSGDALKVAQEMEKQGIVVHTIGIGTPNGSPIRITNDRGLNEYLKDKDGQVIITKLDETMLQKIANITHGFYAPLGNAGEGLRTIYETALKHLPKENFESIEKMPVEHYAIFASIAFLLLTLEPLIYSWRRKRL